MPDDIIKTLSSLLLETEFWSAIVGAVVGGGISFVVQIIALRAAKTQRQQDHKRTEQALGNSLLFKVIRIHSNFLNVHSHIEECLQKAASRPDRPEAWQVYIPLANPPQPITFSSEEMGMLLAQKDDNIFNNVLSMDVVHNSLIDAFMMLNVERRNLTELLKPTTAHGALLSGTMSATELMTIRPKMIEVNSLIESLHSQTKEEADTAAITLEQLTSLLRKKLGLTYKIELKVKKV